MAPPQMLDTQLDPRLDSAVQLENLFWWNHAFVGLVLCWLFCWKTKFIFIFGYPAEAWRCGAKIDWHSELFWPVKTLDAATPILHCGHGVLWFYDEHNTFSSPHFMFANAVRHVTFCRPVVMTPFNSQVFDSWLLLFVIIKKMSRKSH